VLSETIILKTNIFGGEGVGWWPQNKTVWDAVMCDIVGKVLSIPTTFV